jgi:hypothetical protein
MLDGPVDRFRFRGESSSRGRVFEDRMASFILTDLTEDVWIDSAFWTPATGR